MENKFWLQFWANVSLLKFTPKWLQKFAGARVASIMRKNRNNRNK